MVVLALYSLTIFNPAWFLFTEPPVVEDEFEKGSTRTVDPATSLPL